MAAQQGDANEPKDGKSFYGYLYDKHKPLPTPTLILDALLRAIAQHIIVDIGDKSDKNLTPKKLAAFYKAAGYDYDSLFIEMPSQSISFIYQVQACQHMLIQPNNDSEPPTLPALTVKGFVRWQAIQILLEPQTHVPVVQFAVRNWALKNPDDGNPFPTDLPREAFPLEPDPDTDKWHQNCAVKLREQATPKDDPKPNFTEAKEALRPNFPDRKVPFAHVRVDPALPRDYFGNVAYVHVPGQATPRGVPVGRSPERERHRDREDNRDRFRDQYARRQGSSSDEPGRRRRSFEHGHFPQETRSVHLPPRVPEHQPAPRRHSQPRHVSSSSDSDDSPVSPRTHMRRRNHRSNEPPPLSARRMYGPDGGVRVGSSHPHLPSMADDGKRRIIFDIKDKFMSFLPVGGSHDRERSGSRGRKDDGIVHLRTTGSKDRNLGGSRLRGSYSDFNSDETDTEESPHSRRRREERERERDAERPRDRERTRERDREREREKALARERKRSTHLAERPRDRDRDSDERRERDRVRTRDRAGTDRSQRRNRELSDEDTSPKTRTRGSGGSGPFLVRPEDSFRRASSHADIDRKRDWDPRDRDRRDNNRYRDIDRDRERDHDRDRERRERDRDRDMRDAQQRLSSPSKGVTGRVYPDPWN